jgi:chemotaxis response regulator CheB
MKRYPIQILILYHSLLLNESIKKAINHHQELNIVAESIELKSVRKVLENDVPDWILLIKESNEHLPTEVIRAMEKSHNIRLLTLATDCSKIEVFENPRNRKTLHMDSLEQLMDVLKNPSGILNY